MLLIGLIKSQLDLILGFAMNNVSQEHSEKEAALNSTPVNEKEKAADLQLSRELTTDDPMFDDIRHYRDDEVPEVVRRVINDSSLLGGLARNMFPSLPKFMHPVLKPVIRHILRKKFAKIKKFF